jgi:type IV pilus assembly protein PilX
MNRCVRPQLRHRGVSLIITLIMLVIIGLTSVASMRGAISNERAVNNMRMESLAQQYAEVGLRYCQDQLSLPSADRVTGLQDGVLTLSPVASAAWQTSTTWTSDPRPVVAVPNAYLASADSSVTPVKTPECLLERVQLTGGSTTFLVTSRGFSPDYSANTDQTTRSGSVVWLQAMFGGN